MAKSIRSRRTAIAAGALSLALVAPFISPVQAQETATESTTEAAAEPTTTEATPTTPTSDAEPAPAEQPSTSEGTTATTFEPRFDTANFWNTTEAVVERLQLQPGDIVAPRANTIFNWKFRNDNGTLTLIRPQSATAFRTGAQDIPVRVTPANGPAFTTTLRVNIIDERPGSEWEKQLDTRYEVDFEKSTSAKPVADLTLPEGVTVSKNGAALPTGWTVSNDGTTIRVTPPTTFKEGDFDLPIKVNDGTDTFDATLKIAAKNPSKTPAETAGTVADILGPVLGGLIGAGTGGGLIGNIIGGLTGGGSGGGEGETGGGTGRLINVVITNNANPSNIGNNNGSPNVVITDNVNPRDNFSNNGNPNVVITNNANPSVVITGNANPTVEIKDNLSNNGNPSVVVTGNANPVITGNANPVITGNANPVITGNANPVITGNANDNGSNNSVVVTDNANPVVTNNANNNGNDNFRDAGSNNSVVVTNNANPVITGNANDNFRDAGSNNSVVVTDNVNPIVSDNANNNSLIATGNANPEVLVTGNANGGLLGVGSSRKRNGEGTGGNHLVDANVGVDGGSSDPRCIASLVGLGLPLVVLIPLVLAGQVNVPGLNDTAKQAERAFDDAARQFNVEPAQLTAAGGAAAGVVAALLVTAVVRTCIPQINGVDVTIGGSSNNAPAETVAAPVVDTRQS
ncbi:hypothetical protein [Corynebacterium sp. MSK008]|uniref:hypothetical protein n=1 Tax=Corynebacterium sp. MSK008 TaxID=3050188 RepID=UPI00254FA3D0|nr:hypothetical protein [Corynebacterium sp. MSK008]MDK8878564.1 hypothetical protein [Corynebacterium sp. MSK008]